MSSTQALLTMISGGLLAKPKQQSFGGKLAARHHNPEIQRRRLREEEIRGNYSADTSQPPFSTENVSVL